MADLASTEGLEVSRRRALRISLVGAVESADRAYVLAPPDAVQTDGEEGRRATVTIDGQPRSVHLHRLDGRGTAELIEESPDGARRTRVRLGSGMKSSHDGSVTHEVVIEGWRLELRVEDAA